MPSCGPRRANVRCDHTSVLRWLAGEQPRPPVPELVAVVLGDALGQAGARDRVGDDAQRLAR